MCLDMMKNGEIQFSINTPSGHEAREDEVSIRSAAVAHKISHCTNLSAAEASVLAIRSLQEKDLTVTTLARVSRAVKTEHIMRHSDLGAPEARLKTMAWRGL